MSENVIKEPVTQTTEAPQATAKPVTETGKEATNETKDNGIKFFRNCSASLKRFSILLFVINIFLAFTLVSVGTILLGVYFGFALIGILALPILTVLIILIVLARFFSSLIYGFAEIVEKAEK